MPTSKNRRKSGKKAAKKRFAPKLDRYFSEDEHGAVESSLKSVESAACQLDPSTNVDLGADLFDEDAAPEDAAEAALGRAQEMVYEAWLSASKRARIALARRALEVSELCADAWLLLAKDEAKGLLEEREYCRRAVLAGEKAIGPEIFEEDVGYFWGLHETRPYMRARAQLADCQWQLGEREDSIAHLQDMLRLNPNDNQGLRYILVSRLLNMDQLEAAESLQAEHKEEGFADWAFNNALLQFKKHGRSTFADSAVKAAARTNPHGVSLLLGEKTMPKTLPHQYSPGSKEEAVLYVQSNALNWQSTQGALEWLADSTKNIRPKRKTRR